jgi:hypothetical protein
MSGPRVGRYRERTPAAPSGRARDYSRLERFVRSNERCRLRIVCSVAALPSKCRSLSRAKKEAVPAASRKVEMVISTA